MTRFVRRTITAQTFGNVCLLDAVMETTGRIDLFFDAATHLHSDQAAMVGGGVLRTVGNAPWITGTHTGPLVAKIAGQERDIVPTAPEPDLLAGRNVAMAIRNGETADITVDWLTYHHRHHALTGVVILDRAEPGSDEGYADRLESGLAGMDADITVILLDCTQPLGDRQLPPESHPFATPGAPGKDRMEVPKSDPWASPFSNVLVYELIKRRYLMGAAFVTNIDVHDLVPPEPRGSLFEIAESAANGVVQLVGRPCYPWRVADGSQAHFADHVCVQFDATRGNGRWCVDMARLAPDAVFRLVRIGGAEASAQAGFYRYMGLRHLSESVSKIVPKTSLIHHDPLIAAAREEWGHSPILMPQVEMSPPPRGDNSVAIVTTMKNEGPFILEWLAYHRAIGVDGFLVYTNDCTDGTDTLLDILQEKGYVQHRDNPFKGTGLKPQHAALQAAETEDTITGSDWAICMDVDEFLDIKVGDGTLGALFAARPDANLISCTWRLFGNNDVHAYEDRFLIEQFTRCAPEFANKPHQAWGFKTLFKNVGLFKKLGVHRPKGLKPQIWDKIRWYNGSGKAMPHTEYRNAWRSTAETYGYDMVQLNHYAVRSAESFLVKRDRGRVNHVDRDQGLAYWFRMNNNLEEETSILRMLPRLRAEVDKMLADPDIRAAHEHAVACHRAKIAELRATENYAKFYADLTGARMEKLSRLHSHFGANVFLSGPECVPDEVLERDPAEKFFFTVERGETAH